MFRKKKDIHEECWSLDYNLIKWLNEHLKIYKDDANKMVDLERNKFSYQDKNYTLLQMIDKLVEYSDELLEIYFDMKENDISTMEELKNQIYDILKIIHFYLWW